MNEEAATVDDLLARARLLLAALDHAEATVAQNWCEHGELRGQCADCGGDVLEARN